MLMSEAKYNLTRSQVLKEASKMMNVFWLVPLCLIALMIEAESQYRQILALE